MLEENSMKDLLDQGPTVFSKQNELDNSLYEQTLRVGCVCVRACACLLSLEGEREGC